MANVFKDIGSGVSTPYWHPTDTSWKVYSNEFMNNHANTTEQTAGTLNLYVVANGSSHDQLNEEVPTNRFGVREMSVGDTTGNHIGMSTDVFALATGGATIKVGAAVRLPVLADATDDYTFGFGLDDKQTDLGGQYAMIGTSLSQSATHWVTRTRDGSTEDMNTTGVALNASNYFNLEVELNAAASEAKFWINGVLVKTSTANLPSGRINIHMFLDRTGNATQIVNFHVDWMYLAFKPATARGNIAPWVLE